VCPVSEYNVKIAHVVVESVLRWELRGGIIGKRHQKWKSDI
jgi:hypothetical protein